MNTLAQSVVEGVGFGIGWGLIQGGGKLWVKVRQGALVWLTARRMKQIGTVSSNDLTKGLWTSSNRVTPKNYRYQSSPPNCLSSLAAEKRRRERLDKLDASQEETSK